MVGKIPAEDIKCGDRGISAGTGAGDHVHCFVSAPPKLSITAIVKYLIKTLYAAIPRRIDNLSKVLAKRKLDFNDIIADEQELFDVMVNRV